ncbi:MAG: thiamine-phosphate kinase [Luteibaculaceae bacterium]
MRTELEQLGEFGLIDKIKEHVVIHHKETITGIGDDAAVLQSDSDKRILVSTDMLVEGLHFDLSYVPLKHLGYKAVACNVSDICAMNGVAKQITLSLALSNRFSLEAIEEFMEGVHAACKAYAVDLVGGDTTSSKSGLLISVTVLGEANPDSVVLRSGAKEKDLIVVTGDLGAAYMGLQVLEREKSVWKENPAVQPDLEGFDYILQRQLKPEARVDMIDLFTKLNLKPTAMIDISDGLASELLHLCKASSVGAQLFEEKIPIDPQTLLVADQFNLHPNTPALNGGEDYELLFTIAQADYDKIKANPNFSVIGYTTDEASGVNLVTRGGESLPLKAQGWVAF